MGDFHTTSMCRFMVATQAALRPLATAPAATRYRRMHFAISWRNKWMLKQSDYVVTYITHSWGGAAQFAELAEKQKKIIVSLN